MLSGGATEPTPPIPSRSFHASYDRCPSGSWHLKREGVSNAFGVPGAAINPFYAALKASGGVNHTLARHVEGASHMAEGYTRAKAGNIGVCIGTSAPRAPT
ncbi:hypothetical protein SCYAM73S_02746 [Streptomyces cyaneofuscatus]